MFPALARPRPHWSRLFAAGLLFLLFLELLRLLLPLRVDDLFSVYGYFVIAFLFGIYFCNCGFSGPATIRLFLAYLIWLLLTRWLCGDFYLFIHEPLLYNILLCFLCFVMGTVLEAKQRDRFLLAATVIYAGFFTVFALVGLLVAVTGTYIHIPPENVWINLVSSGGINGLNLLSTIRLITAPRIFMAMALLAHRFFSCRKRVWRALLVLAFVILHLALSLCYSRSVQICLSLCWAGLGLLLVLRRENLKKPLRLGLLVLVPLLAFLLCYKSFALSNNFTAAVRGTVAPRVAAASARSEPMIDPDLVGVQKEQQTSIDLHDNRSVAGNVTLSERTLIWASVPDVLRENPRIVLVGQSKKNMMDAVNHALHLRFPSVTEQKPHMHNVPLQVLLLTGIPGFLLVLGWMLLIVLSAFSGSVSHNRLTLSYQLLAVFIAAFILYNMVESFLFASMDLCSLVFFLIAGVYQGELLSLQPMKKAA